jgi:hypothetical protein
MRVYDARGEASTTELEFVSKKLLLFEIECFHDSESLDCGLVGVVAV